MVRERKNGLFLTLNNYKLKYIKSYSPSWTPEYNTDNAFVNYDGTTVAESYKGLRYSASVETSVITEAEANLLIAELRKIVIDFMSTPRQGEVEFSGKVRVSGYHKTPAGILPNERYYRVSFDVSAVALLDSNGGL